MANTNKINLLPASDVSGIYFSKFLNHLEVKNSISEDDENLIFINYEGVIFDNEDMSPLLSIYFNNESKFARFSLVNSAPNKINKKTIGPLINALNKNYVLTSYESTESDGNFYITSEYWLNYKFGLSPAAVHHLISMMPSILSGALSAELKNL
jgi:hypothetical protein